MAKRKSIAKQKAIDSYRHSGKERLNNPPVGLVTPQTDPESDKKVYAYDPHLDPQLVWAGKAEHASFEVPTVSLHVHERIDPLTIIEAVRKKQDDTGEDQLSLFAAPEENPPLRDAIKFYQHRHNWSNRLISGDSLLVMNSLLEKEGLAGKVQMIYMDPPYGIKYGSNFQPFVNKRDVKDGKDEDLTAEPEQIRAFRDTWELGIHSYLLYLRDRFLLARELLNESGSIFVQISDENVHHIRELLDEVFGVENFNGMIVYKTTGGARREVSTKRVNDYIVWYSKCHDLMKFRRLYKLKPLDTTIYTQIESPDGQRRSMTTEEKANPETIPEDLRPFTTLPVHSMSPGDRTPREFEDNLWNIPTGSWRYSQDGFKRLVSAGRIISQKTALRTVSYFNDFKYEELISIWDDTGPEISKLYAVQTSTTPIERCLLLTTDPGDLVFDPTCGSGTTAYVAEQWGRRWITCDTSRVAITLSRQRLMTAIYDYYQLAHPEEGVGSGFQYKTVPHITLKSIANNEPPAEETLYDQPFVDRKISRVTGPFTVEAVPALTVVSPDQILSDMENRIADSSVTRTGETLRQSEWRDELLKTGIRGKSGQYIHFSRIETLPGCRTLHADAEIMEDDTNTNRVAEKPFTNRRAVISFGPQHAPLEQRQVARAIEEAQNLVPKPSMVVFAAFQFDAEAAKDIDETIWPDTTLLKVQMNADLLTDDLKKKRASNDSFWLIGQPDVAVKKIGKGNDAGKYQVTLQGFDYYNPKTGLIESGGSEKIAVWLLDTDYDGRSLFPKQVFFPMSGEKEGWSRLARNLKAETDEELIEAYRGTVSLPFAAGEHKRIAVKIVDDRGIESLKIVELD